IIIKPLLEDGLLLYSGHHEYGDYISLCLNMGYVEFTFDLGSGPATVRSEFPLTMGQWHTIKVSRTSRLAVLKIDQLPEVMTVSPNGFWHLSLPHSLYLGGVHNIHTLPMSLRDKGSFAGCVQKVDINDRTISIISEALGGSNVENCPHACVARPCGPLAKCVPNLDSYECQCNPQNKQCNQAEELPSEDIGRLKNVVKIVTRPEREQADVTTQINGGDNDEDYRNEKRKGQMVGVETSTKSNNTYDDKSYSNPNDDGENKYGNSGSPDGVNRFLNRQNNQQSKNLSNKPRSHESKATATTNNDNAINEETTDGPQYENDSYGDFNDGFNRDYDHNGDRIPYRPDLLKKSGNEQRTRPHRKQPERDPDIDETLMEEMNRIMKNKDDGYESDDDSTDGGSVGWELAMDDEEIRHTGTRMGEVVERQLNSVDDDNENGIDGNRDAIDVDGKKNNKLRDTNTNFSKGAAKMASSSGASSNSRSSSTNNDRQHQKHLVGEEQDVSRGVKYKNKYYRRYQGACFTGTESFFHYSDAETMRRVISYEIDLNLRFKTHSPNGLILWTGRHSALEGDDFLSLGVENGFLHLRYNLGSGEVNIKYNSTKVSDGLWHRVRALRNSQDGTLKVDGGKSITRRSPGKLRQLNTDTGLYVGGLPAASFYTRQRYSSGIVGCISELILAGELRLNFDSTILGTAHNVEPGAP
ncbi:AAEL013602-PA, partial [Aedes aegypti]